MCIVFIDMAFVSISYAGDGVESAILAGKLIGMWIIMGCEVCRGRRRYGWKKI
jgi:hypothetical protein